MERSRIFEILSFPLITAAALIFFIVLLKALSINLLVLCIIYSFLIIIIFVIGIIRKNLYLILGAILFLLIIFFFNLRIIIIENSYKQFLNKYKSSESVIGKVISYPINKQKYLELKVKIIGIKYPWIIDYQKMLPFILLLKIKVNNSIDIKRGDVICINKKITLPRLQISNFKYREYLYFHRIYGIIRANSDNITVNNKIKCSLIESIFKKRLWTIRNYILNLLNNNLNKNAYSFILSIFFGIKSEMDAAVFESFKNTGMIHLLAISGLHISFIGLLFFNFFKFFLSKSKSLLLSIIFLLIYMLLINPSYSSLRAFLMYLLSSVFFIVGIQSSSIAILSITGTILLFINPFCVFDLGFQFSFLATSGILFFTDIIEKKLFSKLYSKLSSIVSVTLSAFLSIFMLQWALFNRVPFFSLLSSIVIVPLFGFLFAALFLCIIFFCITQWMFLSGIINILSEIFLKIINLLDHIPPVKMPEISLFFAYIFLPILIVYFYVIEPYLFWLIKQKNKIKKLDFLFKTEDKL